MADPGKKAYFASCQETINTETKCWNMESFLIKPLQRIMKYPLLLKDLLQNTETAYADYQPLLHAVTQIADVVTVRALWLFFFYHFAYRRFVPGD